MPMVERSSVLRDDLGAHRNRPSTNLGHVLGDERFLRRGECIEGHPVRWFGLHFDREVTVGGRKADGDLGIPMVGGEKVGKYQKGASEARFVDVREAWASRRRATGGSFVRPELTCFDGYPANELSHVDTLGLEAQLALDELGEVEGAVEEDSKPDPRCSNYLEVFALRSVHLAIDAAEQHIRETKDRVERRAKLVTQRHQVVDLVRWALT